MTKQFDESFKSLMKGMGSKDSNKAKKPSKSWVTFLTYILGSSLALTALGPIYNKLHALGDYVNRDEVVKAVRDTFEENNQVVPPDVEKKIESVMKAPRPIIKTKVGSTVMATPRNATDCDWPEVPIIASVESSDQQMYNLLVSTGRFTPMLAVAIIGNIHVESKFDPKTKQIAKYNRNGPPVYGPGRGLVQWERGGRYDTDNINLVSFANKKGLPWDSFNAQVMFIIHEFTAHPEYNSLRKLINNKANTDADFTLEDCVVMVCRKYEKAGTPHMEKRIRAAQLFIESNSLSKYVEEKR